MFCMEFPCICEKPNKKPAAKKRADSPAPAALPSTPPPSVDVAAAMREAMTPEDDRVLVDAKSRWVPRDQYDAEREQDETDFRAAVVMLEPIMHPDEKARFSDILGGPSERALRWRQRNGTV